MCSHKPSKSRSVTARVSGSLALIRDAQQCQRYWPKQQIEHSEHRGNRLWWIVEPPDHAGLRSLSALG